MYNVVMLSNYPYLLKASLDLSMLSYFIPSILLASTIVIILFIDPENRRTDIFSLIPVNFKW